MAFAFVGTSAACTIGFTLRTKYKPGSFFPFQFSPAMLPYPVLTSDITLYIHYFTFILRKNKKQIFSISLGLSSFVDYRLSWHRLQNFYNWTEYHLAGHLQKSETVQEHCPTRLHLQSNHSENDFRIRTLLPPT